MTPDQIRIAEWLRLEVPTLHPAFENVVQMIEDADFPGRSNLVCHACRDICTVIQQYLRVEKTTNADTKTLLNELDVLWSQQRLNEQAYPIASAPTSAEPGKLPEDVSVPREILQAIQSVLEEHRRGAVNQKNQALNMFQIIAPEAAGRPDLFDAHAEQWRDLRGWFHEHAHFTLKEQTCDEGELMAKVLLLETHLLTMISTFYEGVAELDKILGQEPTPDTVARAIARMSHPEQQRYFFDRLENPEWIEPLKQKGMFDTLPAPGRDLDKGTMWFHDWPAGRYLRRMAQVQPAIVAKIFLDLPSTDNPSIVQAMLEATLLMPADISTTLASKLVKVLETQFWFAGQLGGGLAVKLASGGEHKAALQVLRSLLKVIPDPRASLDPGGATGRKHEAVPLLRAFDYATILQARGKELASDLGSPYLSMLCGLLRSSLSEEISVDKAATRKTEDYSFVWQARLEGSSYHESAKHLLIPAVLAAAEILCGADVKNVPAVIAMISKYRYKVYDRIAFHVLAKYAGSAPALAGEKLLDKDSFLDSGVRQEYDALAGATFALLSVAEQDTYLGWIDEGGDRRRFEGRDLTPESIEAAIEHWKFQRLSPLKNVLPTDRQAQFTTMEARFGEAKSYSNPIAQGGAYSISDESPLDRTTLGAMEPKQAIEHLRSWKPTPNDPFPFGYSKDGLGTVFAGVITDFPERFTSRLEDIKTLDPVYITSALRGFDSAIHLEKEFDLGPVLALALWIAEKPATKGGDTGEETEPDFSGAKHNAIDMVLEGLKRHKLPASERETIWRIIDLLSDDQWGILDYRDPSAQTKDAWFHSLNYLRPKAVRAAIQYLQWSMKNAEQTTLFISGTPELADFFNRHTDPAYESCLSVRLIFGEFFPYLHAWDVAWTVGAVHRIFPDAPDLQALRDVAWTAYLTANQAYDTTFALLEPHYRAAITIGDEQRLLGKSSSLEHASGILSYHLLQQYWRGRISLAPGSLLSDFFLQAEERGRRAAIIYAGRSLRETTDDVPVETIQRLVELWENRLETAKAGGASGEIRAFSWWFFTRFFDDEWALKSLHAGLKLTGGHLDMIMDSLGRLSSLAEKYPVMVVECTQMICDASPDYVDLWAADLITILSAALRSNDLVARLAARKFIEDLGTKGKLEYRNLLDIDPNAAEAI